MATAGPVLQVAVFDPAATHIMGQAFDCACRSLHNIGQLNNAVKEVIAKRIVELARDGERDPNKLCEHSLQTLGFFPGAEVPTKCASDRDHAPLTRKEKAQQSLKIQEIGQALIAAGFATLDKQATALEVRAAPRGPF